MHGQVLLGNCAGGALVWFRIMGGHAEGLEKVAEFSQEGGEVYDRRSYKKGRRWVGISSA